MLRFFVALKLEGEPAAAPHLASFNSMCVVMDLLLAATSRTVDVCQAADSIEAAVAECSRLRIAAYGERFLKSKRHWVFDVAGQIRCDCLSIDAFVVERIHIRIKSIAEKIDNATSFE